MAVIDWEPEFRYADFESALQKLADKIHQISRDNIPVSNFRHKQDNTPWMNADILMAVRNKTTRWKKYKYCKTPLNMQRYNDSKYVASPKVREAKRRYEKKVAGSIKSNPKAFWKFVQSKTKVKEEIPSLKDDQGYIVTDYYRKAELLNTFFKSVFTVETPDDIPDFPLRTDQVLNTVAFNEDTIRKHLESLEESKSVGPDDFHPKFLKETAKSLSKPISTLFTKSFDEMEIAKIWKNANVTPLHKKG